MPEPYDSHAQTMSALQLANEVRLARVKLKRAVKNGDLLAAAVVADPPDCARRMTVGELLGAQKRWGAEKVARFCTAAKVSETKTLQSFTTRQRAVFVRDLPSGSLVAGMLRERFEAENTIVTALCQRLNGSGPCLGREGHGGPCVTATHVTSRHNPGTVRFRRFDTCEVIAEVDCHPSHGRLMPTLFDLAAMLEEATANDNGWWRRA